MKTSSVRRQKGEFQNGWYKKRRHTKSSKKRTFLTQWYAHAPTPQNGQTHCNSSSAWEFCAMKKAYPSNLKFCDASSWSFLLKHGIFHLHKKSCYEDTVLKPRFLKKWKKISIWQLNSEYSVQKIFPNTENWLLCS